MELRIVVEFELHHKRTRSGKQFNFWDETGNDQETGEFCLVKFGTGSNTELTQKYARVNVKNYIRTSPHIYKQISPIFN